MNSNKIQKFSNFVFVTDSESGSGAEVDPNLPYPGIAPYALKYLSQTTRPRSWCLALISNPYPFLCKYTRYNKVESFLFVFLLKLHSTREPIPQIIYGTGSENN